LLDHVTRDVDAGRVESGFGHTCSQHGLCDSCIADSCGWCDREQRCLRASATCGPGHAPVSENQSSCPPQVPHQTDFRRQDALEMVRYAWAAYYDEPERHRLPDSAEVVKAFHYRIGIWDDAFAYIALDSSTNRIVLAFRGTDTLTQLMVELISHSLVPFMTGNTQVRVNEFFLAAADDLLPQLTPVLRDLEIKCPACQLWITGHSLGASMALLAAFNVSFWTREQPILLTFGQPRSVNGPFARMMEERISRIYRLVNARDPVPHIPRCHRSDAAVVGSMRGCVDDKLGGYHHVGTELWFPHGDYLNGVMCRYRECVGVPAGEDLSCADGLYFPQDADVLDHHGYFKVLDNGFCGTGKSTGTMHDVILV